MEKDEGMSLVAEVDGKLIAKTDLDRVGGYSSHVGDIAIGIMKDYRSIGIGTEMLKTLIVQVRKMDFKVLILNVYSTNKMAYRVYEKVGFKETGRIPKFFHRNGNYIDKVVMTKEI